GPGTLFETVQHTQWHVVFAGELNRSDLQHLGAQAGHLEHFLEGDLFQAAGAVHYPRVGGVDTVHIGVDLAFVRLQRRRQGHASGIGAATTEGGDIAVGIHTLEASNNHHLARVQLAPQPGFIYMLDACLAEGAVGLDAHLGAGIGDGWDTNGLELHGQQANGDLFAGGKDHVQLPRVGLGAHILGQADQAVGLPAHGGYHDHQIMALGLESLDFLGHLGNALHTADRGTPKLLDNKCHLLHQLPCEIGYPDHCVDPPPWTDPCSSHCCCAIHSAALARALSSAATSVPPPWAMSGRPPPLPPTACAVLRIRSPALTRAVRSLVTPATSTTLPSSSPPSRITAEPNLFFNWSISASRALPSSPSRRLTSTFMPPSCCASPARSLPAAVAALALSCSRSFSSWRLRSITAASLSSRLSREPLTNWAAWRSCSSDSLTQSSAAWPVIASMRRTPEAMPPSAVMRNRPISPVRSTWVPPQSSTEKPPPMVRTRTWSPYFSPNSAMAPLALAVSMSVTSISTAVLARIWSLTMRSSSRNCSGRMASKWLKSKRRR